MAGLGEKMEWADCRCVLTDGPYSPGTRASGEQSQSEDRGIGT